MNSLWTNIHAEAVRLEHPEPEKMADSALRARAHGLALKVNRHHSILISKVPPSYHAAQPKPPKAAARPVFKVKCRALTLGNKQCAFNATCGNYCTRHASY
jgi:hypothetical protein